MSKTPFEKQRLQVNLVEQIEHEIALGHGASGDVLLAAIEQSVGFELDAPLRNVLPKFSSPAESRRGRPSNPKGREALRNKHSQWKNGHFHSADNHVESEDFDAEIERQFPAP